MNKIFYYYNKAYDWFVDKNLNIETSKCIKLDEHDNIMNFMYEPSSYLQIKSVFKKYPLCRDDHLIDFGCGKGRVLVMASEYGCRNLYGIDISSYLLEIARVNLNQCKQTDVVFELLCMNAKYYDFNQKINKIFFYNPFQLKVFIHIFKSLLHSIDDNPRMVTVYFNGAQKSTIEYFEKMGRFQLIGKEEKKGVYIYTHIPCNAKLD